MQLGRGTTGAARVADAFGANVDVAAGGATLALVIGRRPVHGAVAAVGGRVVTDLGAGRALAVIAVEALLALRSHPSISHAGPVSVDPERFARFVAAAGIGDPTDPTPTPIPIDH